MANERPNRKTRIIIWTVAVALIILVAYLAHMATRTVLQVRTFTVARGSIRSTVSTNGKVQPASNYEAHAPFPGLIQALYVQQGEKVEKGKLLLKMGDADAKTRLQQARAQLAGAEANEKMIRSGGTPEQRYTFAGQIQQARAEEQSAIQALETLDALQAKGAASPSEVAQAKNRLATAKSSLNSLEQRSSAQKTLPDLAGAQAQVAEARSAVAAAVDAISNSRVRAPFAGTVYSISVAKTDYAQQGDRLLQMANLDHLQVLAYFDEPDIGKLRLGEAVTITWVAKPGETWHGHIIRLPSTVVSYTTRNVGELLCSIDDAHDGLLPDTNVDVRVTTSNAADVLYIPREALHTEQGLNYVYKVVHGKLKRSRIQVSSLLNLTQVQVLSGVEEGDVVALGSLGGQPLTNGVAVDTVR